MKQDRPRVVPIALCIIAVVLLAVTNNINWGGHWRTTLQADAKGYYAYLPAILIHNDLHFSFLEEAESVGSNANLFFDYRVAPTGVPVNKYWCGTALLQSPFFAVAHGIALAKGSEPVGFEKPYVMAICLAAIAYALIGLWALDRVLITYDVHVMWRATVLVAIMFGTHLFYYVIVAPGMSHAYSFALVSLLFLVVRRCRDQVTAPRILALGVLVGLIVLVRPVNGIVLLAIPFLIESPSRLRDKAILLRAHRAPLVTAFIMAGLIVGIQPLLYFIGTGHWWVDTYPGESFNWTDPHGWDILLSYKKGLFLYTPLCLLAMVGLYHLGQRSRCALLAWIVFFLVLVYVLSSWWNWWYGGSFSARPFVEYLPLFAVPLALALQQSKDWAKKAYLTGVVFTVLLCQVQTYQARYYRIHYEDMDRERYWGEFLRLDKLP